MRASIASRIVRLVRWIRPDARGVGATTATARSVGDPSTPGRTRSTVVAQAMAVRGRRPAAIARPPCLSSMNRLIVGSVTCQVPTQPPGMTQRSRAMTLWASDWLLRGDELSRPDVTDGSVRPPRRWREQSAARQEPPGPDPGSAVPHTAAAQASAAGPSECRLDGEHREFGCSRRPAPHAA